MDITSHNYYLVKNYVQLLKNNKKYSFDEALMLKTDSDDRLIMKLNNLVDACVFDEITIEEWKSVVSDVYHSGPIILPGTIISHDYKRNDFKPSTFKGTAWYEYKCLLVSKNFTPDAIDAIEKSACEIVNQLALNDNEEAVKGLVVGNVQSGKTANMAGVIAQAADQGWNLFIILSGTIENLREQTQTRLINDLKASTNVSITPIDKVKTTKTFIHALKNLDFSEGSKKAYLNVCLKNSTRLSNLLTWLNGDTKTREQINLVIIDDEADQASINTKKKPKYLTPEEAAEWDERTKINKLITYLFTNKDKDGNECSTKFKSINYIAYTATPYANVLNEAESAESTYPSNFISSLTVPESYFGPQVIFGIDGEFDGIPIINEVSTEEVEKIKNVNEGKSNDMPQSLKNAVLWFYCCLAIRRNNGYKGPVSMLIHSSQKQVHHENIADVIKKWFLKYGNDMIKFVGDCKKIYDDQVKKFDLICFNSLRGEYPYKVDDYPPFESFSNTLIDIFNNKIQSIKIDENEKLTFSKGINLCIDNCSHSGIENVNEHIRLIYPDGDDKPDYATGYIVIGGATLSRGLTIEGLVCTYFLRTIKQADTLMQMGRWFGYRKGYEMLPRIWMTKNTREQYEFLSLLDYKLRESLSEIQKLKISPAKVGVKILSHPLKRFLCITSDNKMKDAIISNVSYNGAQYQTTIMYNNVDKLKNNYTLTEKFVNSLENKLEKGYYGEKSNALVWVDIDNAKVISFLKSLQFPKTNCATIDYDSLSQWLNKNGKEKWRVVFAGVSGEEKVNFGNFSVSKVNRSKLAKSTDELIKLGVLRNTLDVLADVPNEYVTGKVDTYKTEQLLKLRVDAGLDMVPVLILYLVDKDSKPIHKMHGKVGGSGRIDLNAPYDIIGTFVYVPEIDGGSTEQYVSIPVDYQDLEAVDVGE